MKFWQSLSFAEPEQLIDLAKICDEVGFHGTFLSDHLFFPKSLESKYPYSPDGAPAFAPETPFPDPFSTVGALAAVTEKLRFSLGVYILPLRHPLEVAKAAATLAILSNNRFSIGAGAGWMKEEFDQFGVEFKTRGKRFNETIDVLRAIWKGGMVEYHGEFFDFDPLQMSPAPSESVPILIGGVSRAAMRRTAERGDGWIGPGNDPSDVSAILENLTQLRRDAGREKDPFETIIPLITPPDIDTLKRLRDLGMDGTVSYPFSYTLGPTSSLDDKRRYLEGFAEQFVRPLSE